MHYYPTSQKITFKTIFSMPGESEAVTRAAHLDGIEVNKEEQGGINKESAIWSADKKTPHYEKYPDCWHRCLWKHNVLLSFRGWTCSDTTDRRRKSIRTEGEADI